MKYKGIIFGSRTYDITALSGMLDAGALAFLAYAPDQLGITVPVYAVIRAAITMLQAYIRAKTTGPVGEGRE